MFTSPGEIAISLAGLSIHWYGIVMAFAILIGLYTVSVVRRKFYPDVAKDYALDLAFYLVLGGIIGARLYYVILDSQFYIKFPLESFAIWHGGLSIHGAILGATITGITYSKVKKYEFLRIADLFVYGLCIGQCIGRWGNFFNSEAFGKPTNLPWKLFIPLSSRPINLCDVSYYHPTFLYESVADLIIFFILILIVRRLAKGKSGIIFFSYMILYSIVRFLIESIRIDSVLYVFGLPIAQFVSILFFIIGIIGVAVCVKKSVKIV